jgi:hypothetical protein
LGYAQAKAIPERVEWMLTFTDAAYHLVRIRNLMRGGPQAPGAWEQFDDLQDFGQWCDGSEVRAKCRRARHQRQTRSLSR